MLYISLIGLILMACICVLVTKMSNSNNAVMPVIHYYENTNTNFKKREFCDRTNWRGCFRDTKKEITFFNPSVYNKTYKLIKVAPFNFCEPNAYLKPSAGDSEEDYKVVFMKNDVPLYVISRAEDGRLIYCKNKFFCIYTRPNFNSLYTTSDMYIFDLYDHKKWRLKYKNTKSIEKNWSPFVYDNELYLSYNLSPHIVLHCDIETGKCTEVHNSTSALPNNIRGSSQSIPWKGKYIGVAHITKENILKREYVHYFYLMESTPPFAITKSSTPFRFPKYFHDWRDQIQFCCGIYLEDHYFHISYGVADCLSFILKVHENEVENMLNGHSQSMDIKQNSMINYDNLKKNRK